MRQWASEDYRRTRDVAYHCAQLLGLLRHYPNNLPFEAFLTFHAGVVLACVALVLNAGDHTTTFDSTIRLDQLDPGNDSITTSHTRWIENGGNTRISLSGVPSLCSFSGRQAVLDQTAYLLKRHQVWGMARNLTKVVLALGSGEINRDHHGVVISHGRGQAPASADE